MRTPPPDVPANRRSLSLTVWLAGSGYTRRDRRAGPDRSDQRRLVARTVSARNPARDLRGRALYNGFLAGVSLDGRRFFYENPLESLGHHHRKGWFACACCPPNAARLFASLGEYVYAQRGDDLYVNLYVGSDATVTVDGVDVTLSQETDYPWGEETTVSVATDEDVEATLRLRVPEWCESPAFAVNGETVAVETEDGYAVVERTWADGDGVSVSFEMPVRRLAAHPDVPDDADRLAYQRGPLVYCVEETDLGRPTSRLRADPDADVEVRRDDDLLDGVAVLDTEGEFVTTDGWDDGLYGSFDDLETAASYTAIPYYGWDNREDGRMHVWLPTA